jgi:hypothetical protein
MELGLVEPDEEEEDVTGGTFLGVVATDAAVGARVGNVEGSSVGLVDVTAGTWTSSDGPGVSDLVVGTDDGAVLAVGAESRFRISERPSDIT